MSGYFQNDGRALNPLAGNKVEEKRDETKKFKAHNMTWPNNNTIEAKEPSR